MPRQRESESDFADESEVKGKTVWDVVGECSELRVMGIVICASRGERLIDACSGCVCRHLFSTGPMMDLNCGIWLQKNSTLSPGTLMCFRLHPSQKLS